MISLRDYQENALQGLLDALKGHRCVLYTSPTNSGKTVVLVALVLALRKGDPHLSVLWFAHTAEIVEQTVQGLIASGMPEELIGVTMRDDPRYNPTAPVQVGTVQTLRRRDLPGVELVIVDEAHHATAATYQALLKAYPLAWIVGATASPFRTDGRGLREAGFEELVVGLQPAELVERGWLAPVTTYSVAPEFLPDLKGVRTKAGEYHQGDLEPRVSQARLIGPVVDLWEKHAKGERTVVFSVGRKHGRLLAEAFAKRKIPVGYLDGETPRRERHLLLQRFTTGQIRVLVNPQTIVEGLDVPHVRCVVVARPTQSMGLWWQMTGRLRVKKGEALVLDCAGNAYAHGTPQEDREFSLDAPPRRKGGPARVKCCPVCSRLVPLVASTCECEHVFWVGEMPAEIAGELVPMRPPVECELCSAPFDRRASAMILAGKRRRLCRMCKRKPALVCADCGGAISRNAMSASARAARSNAPARCLRCVGLAPKPRAPCKDCGGPCSSRTTLDSAKSGRPPQCIKCYRRARRVPKVCPDCGAATSGGGKRCRPCGMAVVADKHRRRLQGTALGLAQALRLRDVNKARCAS